MTQNKLEPANLHIRIIKAAEEANPQTVEQLIKILQSDQTVRRQEILDAIMKLYEEGKIVLRCPKVQFSFTLREYILSAKSYWYWIIVALSVTTTILVFSVPENAYPVVYARYILGSIFVLLLPGYSLVKALFPTKDIDNIERIALSIGTSLVLVPITCLFLYYTPWNIRITPVTLSLLVLAVALATTAVIREYQTAKPKKFAYVEARAKRKS